VPWWARIGVKLVLSRLPIRHDVWRRLGIFGQGEMADAAYALGVFEGHFTRAKEYATFAAGFVALELGPGDSLLSGMIASSYGASRTYLIDSGLFARDHPEARQHLEVLLRARGLAMPAIADDATVKTLCAACGTRYLTHGVDSFEEISDASVDFVWSHAVLEHVRKHDFARLVRALHRVMRPGAVASHTVDLRDHLGGGLNHLRFSDALWENRFMASAGFYTNRLGMSEMVELFAGAGFKVVLPRVSRWAELPTPARKMAAPFRRRSADDLSVNGFDVVLRVP